ncbi:hypothetical protein ACIQ62_35385 [Streptomyces sp. NPDC096319]|uniref:hypothetical protein n=1 Tax=Streptomyces sp. NPDC096319 TaxID=3366084 RepID=UPI0038131C27
MRQALAAAAPGYVAAALERLAFDDALSLPPAQQMLLLDRAAELNPGVVDDLAGAKALGYHDKTAARLVTEAGRTWSRYFPGDHTR